MMEEKVDDEQSAAAADARNGVSLNRTERLSILLSAVALVILALLPDEGIGPVQAFNPSVARRLLVIVMLASTAGYAAQRCLGQGSDAAGRVPRRLCVEHGNNRAMRS
jgi:hypothetical protein